ncbi:MAG: gephyrin-like molybdotransferase Glp [Myxococcota bacterium]
MISIEEARKRVTEGLVTLGSERMSVHEAVGRALSTSITARRALPDFDNSAMDGFAVCAKHVGTQALRVVVQVPAGVVVDRRIGPGEAARIFTGAPMPPGADAVVMQENARLDGDQVWIEVAPKMSENVRFAGEDLSVGEKLAAAGADVTPGLVAVLAAQGIDAVDVVRKPRVAIVPNGDELVPVGVDPKPGQIPNSNASMLAAQVLNAGGLPWVFPPIPDDEPTIAAALREAGRGADLVLTTGGMSVGDFDYTRRALEVDAELGFYKVRMKPGKPLGLGRLGGTPVLGLPGNPVSAFVGFEVFGRPMLRTIGGFSQVDHPRSTAVLAKAVRPNRSRPELIRCDVIDGALHPWPKQGSAMMSSLLHAQALAIIPAGTQTLDPGSEIQTIWLQNR